MSQYMCQMCMHVGEVWEFQTNQDDENPAPDLFETGVCPFCDAFIEDISDLEID